jgi:hypothetical protein
LKPAALAALAIGVLILSGLLSYPWQAGGQGNSAIPVKNGLVMLVPQNSPAASPILSNVGTPSSLQALLAQAEQLLSIQIPRGPTNATGYFAIGAPSGTDYNLTVSAPGYVQTISSTLSVGNGSGGMANVPKNFTMMVQPSAVVSGVVTDANGNPLPGIVVSTGLGPDSANYDVTMDNGVFALDTGLQTGNHTIYAFKPTGNLTQIDNLLSHSGIPVPIQQKKFPFNMPKSGFEMFSTTASLTQGKLTTLNIKLDPSQEISGRVFDQANRHPLNGIPVMIFDRSGDLIDATATDSMGNYLFNNGLSKQAYGIVVPSIPSLPYDPQGRNVTAPSQGVNFYLQDAGTIAGSVVDAKGNSVPGATVIGSPAMAGGGNITAALPSFLASSTSPATTDADGKFTLRGDGIASVAEWFTVEAYFGNALPVSGSAIVVGGATSSSVRIVLDFSDLVTVKGLVQGVDGKPIAGARIIPSFATSIPASLKFAAISNKDGSFTMSVPLKDSSARTLFDSLAVYAAGFNPATVAISPTGLTIVKMAKSPNILVGRVVTQESNTPSIETAITKKGTLLVSDGNATIPIQTTTNSKLLDASFNFTSKEIVIHLEGVQGSQGKSEFAIPADLLAGPYSVKVDGHTLPSDQVTVTQNKTDVTISFSHDLGAREIDILGGSVVPEFPVPVVVAALGIGVALFVIRRLRLGQRL